MLTLLSAAHGDPINLPYDHPRTSENLLSNTSFNGLTSWELISGPAYDSEVSHTADSGSIRFVRGDNTDLYAQIKSIKISNTQFKYDTPYTISYYLKALHTPAYVSATLHMYDANGNRTFSYSTGRGANSATGEWQEVTSVVTITDHAIVQIQVVIEAVDSASYASDFYIDDAYFGEGISFAEPPATTRKTFSGANVQVDKLGNWSVYENNTWKDFFPLGIYVDLSRSNYSSLSTQGFNVVMSQQFLSQVQKAKDATSTFNPNGMRAGLRLQRYASGTDIYWTPSLLASTIDTIDSNFSETLLFYDWDNENNWTSWSSWQAMVTTIRTHDANHPIYILNGFPAVQRLFHDLSDVAGTYVGFNLASSSFEAGGGKFEILQELENQSVPVSIAQINEVDDVSYGFRLRVYDALIKGARGIVWWGDTSSHVENRSWWDDITNLRHEIDAMMPIIKQPHWTTWSAVSSDPNIYLGTRDYNGEGYLIVMNPQSTTSLVTFALSGGTQNSSEVWNYFDNTFVTLVQAGKFTVSLPAHSTAVYRLSINSYPEFLQNGSMEASGSPISQWTASGGTGEFTQDTTVKYAGTYSAKIANPSTSADNTYVQSFGSLQPNTRYRFSAMIRTDSVIKLSPTDDYSGAIVQLYAGGLNQFIPLPGLSGTNDWTLIQKTFTTPANPDATWYIRLRLRKSSGSVWFDNISLKQVP